MGLEGSLPAPIKVALIPPAAAIGIKNRSVDADSLQLIFIFWFENVFFPSIINLSAIISTLAPNSDTAFIDARGNIFLKTIKPEIDVMRTGHWSKSYINSGSDEFNNYTYVNCTIANVSSAIIKNDNYKKYFKISGKYKQAGDWLFYANVMQKGKIAYYNKPLNYYRVHGNNVSSVTKKEAHIKEINQIHNFFDNTYGLNRYQKNQIK